MDASKYAESDFVCVDLISSLANKTGVIIDATSEQTKFGERLKVTFEFSGKKKSWNPPQGVIKNFIVAFGPETMMWSGKKVQFNIMNNKVVATPIMDHVASIMQQEKTA
jgi:hypothetical protein